MALALSQATAAGLTAAAQVTWRHALAANRRPFDYLASMMATWYLFHPSFHFLSAASECLRVLAGGWQGNRVAIKVVSPQRVSDEARLALYTEAITMSQLQHPYIARVFGVVDDGEHLAMVMQYYRRGNLEDFMGNPKTRDWFDALDMATRIKMACMVASAMHYLTTKSTPLVHGDLKASNLLLDDMMHVYITDFGLARQRIEHKQQRRQQVHGLPGSGVNGWMPVSSPGRSSRPCQQQQQQRGGGGGGAGTHSAPTSTSGVSGCQMINGSPGGGGGGGGGVCVEGASTALSEVVLVRQVVSGPLERALTAPTAAAVPSSSSSAAAAAAAQAGGGDEAASATSPSLPVQQQQQQQQQQQPSSASSAATHMTSTCEGVSVHTAAPEVLRDPGAPRDVSSDVFSFGMVLLQICTGKAPYKGLSPSTVRQLVLEGRRPPVPSSVPASVAAVVAQCTAPDPQARPSFANVIRRLEAAKKDMPSVLDDTTFMGF